MCQHYILYRGREDDEAEVGGETGYGAIAIETGGGGGRGQWRTRTNGEEEALQIEGAEASERRALLSEAVAETVAGNPSETGAGSGTF